MAQTRSEIDKSSETAEIKGEIERTRVEMSETIGEIQERLRPDHIIQQAKHTVSDAVTEAATGKVRTIMQSASETATRVADQTRDVGRSAANYVRMHPVQMALLAGGITWWLLRGRDRSDDWAGASEGYRSDTGDRLDTDYVPGEDRSLREKAGEYIASARETVGEFASSARETVGEYAETAASTARDASDRVRQAAGTASVRARETWNRTSATVDDFVHDYPLAAGALAVAVGAAIGLSVPGTEFEDRTLGERRDQAMERARAKARELKEDVTQRANRVADAVVDIATAGAPRETGATGATGATSATSAPSAMSASPSTTGSVYEP